MDSFPNWLSNTRLLHEEDVVSDDKHPLISLCGSEERSDFEKDIDAIIHFSAFRRLAHKTQVMLNPHFDFPRTRLMHSIETMRIARQLAALSFRIMRIEDKELFKNFMDALCAVCLAHDIGHPPFGHEGERALNDILLSLRDCDIKEGFDANKQNIRILSGFGIGDKEPFRHALNLTAAVLDGLMKKKPDSTFNLDNEVKVRVNAIVNCPNVRNPLTYFMDAADDISNIACDCEDGLKLGLLRESELIEQLEKGFVGYNLNWDEIQNKDWKEIIKNCRVNDNYDRIKSSLIKGLIVHFCKVFKLIIENNSSGDTVPVDNLPEILNDGLKDHTRYPLKDGGKGDFKEIFNILFHCGKRNNMRPQSQFIYDLKTAIYNKGILKRKEITDGENDARTIIYGLWNELKVIAENPTSIASKRIIKLLPGHLKDLTEKSTIFQANTPDKTTVRYRLIADHICGMTDRYAISAFKRLHGIKITI